MHIHTPECLECVSFILIKRTITSGGGRRLRGTADKQYNKHRNKPKGLDDRNIRSIILPFELWYARRGSVTRPLLWRSYNPKQDGDMKVSITGGGGHWFGVRSSTVKTRFHKGAADYI